MARLVLNKPMVDLTSRSMALQHVRKTARIVESAAKSRAPVKTGHLKTSIGSSESFTAHKITAKVGSDLKYAHVNDRRAAPHIIRAKRKKALHFWWEREALWFTGPMVNHPGMTGNMYLTTALMLARGEGFLVVLVP